MINLDQAIKILKEGGIVIYPTDTAYGIGCRMDDSKAIKRLFKIRRRPQIQATPVLVDSIVRGEKYLTSPLPDNVRHLMERYWPGALTIIYPCLIDKVPSLVRGRGTTLGLRMPSHDIALSLIKGIGVPLLGPSANFHDEVTPYSFENLDKELIKLVDYVVVGQCKLKQASTVIDCSMTPWKIIRQGAVKIDEVKKVILHIDTRDNQKVSVVLEIDGRKDEISKTTTTWTSQLLLPLIGELVQKNKISISQITEVKVGTGPGSFTGIRVGIAVANTLGWLLNIPVNGRKDKLVEPVYQ